jgi:hypothetical protein
MMAVCTIGALLMPCSPEVQFYNSLGGDFPGRQQHAAVKEMQNAF